MRFRSRLEARWAAFFTLLKWPWEYEPEMGLDGWIPDFGITLPPTGRGILVEVKPALVPRELERHKARIEQSGTEHWVWLVGSMPNVALLGQPVRAGFAWLSGPVCPSAAGQRLWVRAGNALQWRRM